MSTSTRQKRLEDELRGSTSNSKMDLALARRIFTGSEAPTSTRASLKATNNFRGPKKSQKKPALNWVVIGGDPSEAQAKTSREKAVKSHVAHVQHFKKWKKQQKDQQIAEANLPPPSDPEVEEITRGFPPRRSSKRPTTSTTIITRKPAEIYCMCDTTDGSCIGSCNLKGVLDWMEEVYGHFLRLSTYCSTKISGGGFRSDPFKTYPIDWNGNVPEVFDHYLHNMVPPALPEIDQGKPGSARRLWLPFALNDEAVFQVVMLLAASSSATLRGQSPFQPLLLSLKQKSIKSINEGLNDPTRANSDYIIMAVAKMAVYEAMYGSHRTYGLHMAGLLRMLEAKMEEGEGYDSNLGTNGMLTGICLWVDRNLAAMLDMPRFLAPLEEKFGVRLGEQGRIVGEYKD